MLNPKSRSSSYVVLNTCFLQSAATFHNVLLHELLHIIGLDHTNIPDTVMNYKLSTKNIELTLIKQDINYITISPNDVANIKFIIEMENESIYDFYMLITSDDVTNNENKKIELNNFVKYEALSFLSRLNLYR